MQETILRSVPPAPRSIARSSRPKRHFFFFFFFFGTLFFVLVVIISILLLLAACENQNQNHTIQAYRDEPLLQQQQKSYKKISWKTITKHPYYH